MKGGTRLPGDACFPCVCVCVEWELIQSGLIFEVIQLLQQQRWILRLKHTNHFNLKPIPSFLTSAYSTDVRPFSPLPPIRFTSAATGQEVDWNTDDRLIDRSRLPTWRTTASHCSEFRGKQHLTPWSFHLVTVRPRVSLSLLTSTGHLTRLGVDPPLIKKDETVSLSRG